MSEELGYDEDKAISFIRQTLPTTVSEKNTDDEILYIIDIIWDYYEKNGYLSLDSEVTEEESIDLDRLVNYVVKELKNDEEIVMDPDDIKLIVKGELEYEESIEDIF